MYDYEKYFNYIMLHNETWYRPFSKPKKEWYYHESDRIMYNSVD